MSRKAREPFPLESDRLKYFVDRGAELERAQQVLSSPPGTPLPVLVFHGVGGMGKTSVLEKIRADLCGWRPEQRDREAELPHAWVDFSSAAAAAEGAVRSRTGLLDHIKRELDAHGLRFPRFELVWARYRELLTGQAFQPATASPSEFGALLEAAKQVGGTVGSAVGLLHLLGQKGVRWYEEWRHGKLAPEGIEDWEHAYEAAEALPEALAVDIAANLDSNEAEESYRWPVLFFDSLEWLEEAGEEGRLTVEAIQELCRYLPEVPIIIGSRSEVEWERDEIGEREIEHLAVDVIPEGYREEYLRLRGVGERSWHPIIEVTDGHALWMGIAADIALDVEERDRRPVTSADLLGPEGKMEELLERLLERLGGERALTDTVRAACVCRWFDYELLEAVRGQTDDFAGQFGDLGGLSFVMALERDEEGRIVRAKIHQTVRELVLGGMRSEDLERLARRGAQHCEGQDERWEAERVYFLMLAEPEEGLREGGRLFDRVNFEWNRALGEEVLEASRDGWRWRHIGKAERPEEPWQFADREGDLLRMEGNPTAALRAYERGLEGTRRERDRHGKGQTLGSMAIIHRQQGRYEEAMGLYEQSLEVFRELGDRAGEGATLGNMAVVHQVQGRYEQAMGLYEQDLEICRKLGDQAGEGATLGNMAIIHQQQGRHEEAMGLYEQSLGIFRELGDRYGEGLTLNNMAIIHQQQGRYEQAMGLYEQSLEIRRELGDRHGEGETLNNMGAAHREQGTYEEAMGLCEQSLEIFGELQDRSGEGATLNNMAGVHQAQGGYEEAMGLYEQSLEICRELGEPQAEGRTLMNMGTLALRTGDLEKAREHWEKALKALEGLGVPEEGKVRAWLEELGNGE